MAHLKQTAETIDESVVFNLALGRANRTSIVLCGGSVHGFAQMSQLYAVWQGLNLPVALVAPKKLKKYLPTGANVLLINEGDDRANLSAYNAMESSGLVVVGPDMHMTSFEQIFFAKYLAQSDDPALITDEVLPMVKFEARLKQNKNIIWLASLKNIQAISQTSRNISELQHQRGIFGVEEYLRALPVSANCIIAYDAMNLYSYVRAADTLVHTPAIGTAQQSRLLMMTLLPITVAARSRGVSLLDRVRLMHALYDAIATKCLEDSKDWERAVKQFL